MAEKEEKQVEMVSVAKELENRFQLPDGSILSQEELSVWIANKILKIEKAVC